MEAGAEVVETAEGLAAVSAHVAEILVEAVAVDAVARALLVVAVVFAQRPSSVVLIEHAPFVPRFDLLGTLSYRVHFAGVCLLALLECVSCAISFCGLLHGDCLASLPASHLSTLPRERHCS